MLVYLAWLQEPIWHNTTVNFWSSPYSDDMHGMESARDLCDLSSFIFLYLS